MAEKGAHLSTTFVKKPSIFELIAQDSLSNTFYPALKHLTQFLFSQDPIKYGFLFEWFEEVYLTLNLFLQFHYLRNYDASFAEKFYSLKRIALNSQIRNVTLQLTKNQKFWSLVFCVTFPYIKNKMKIIAENIQNGEEYKNQIKIPKKHKETFVFLHKYFHVVVESLRIIFYLRYMTGRSETHSVSLRLAGVTLVYFHEKSQNICWRTIMKEIYSGNWRSCLTLLSLLKSGLGRGLELCAFFIQFLNWWHAEQLNTKFFAYPIPPPPHEMLANGSGSRSSNICPICKDSFKIPTALPISGYVFCFTCIRKFVSQNRKCPVTNLPAEEDDLIRIYVDLSTGL